MERFLRIFLNYRQGNAETSKKSFIVYRFENIWNIFRPVDEKL